jgi:NodT family efflux transporter outer membrane factor (OMF) lipoprotein
VETYVRSLDLTRKRRSGGVGTDLDVAQAETQLKSAQAQIPAVELQRTKLLHAIATLCGTPATTFALEPQSELENASATIPTLLPSELLERRPDIAAAERRVAAANADIGVAKTAFYPRILFRGFAGFQSINAGTLFDWPSRVWSLGPSLELPIFTGGRNRAELAISKAAYQETSAVYRQTVLAAFQEVEDQLAAQRLLTSQLEFENAALSAARRTLEIANNRYKAGLVTYLEVATAQSSALVHERTVVQLSAERLTAMVGLAKALGGGWTESRSASAASAK